MSIQSAVSVNCPESLPNEMFVGDEIVIEAEVVNNNPFRVGVVVGFNVGSASTSKIVNLSGNTTSVVSDTFMAETSGDVSVSVNKSDVIEGGLVGTPHDPGTPTF